MPLDYFLFLLLVVSFWLFLFGERKANLRRSDQAIQSLPAYHGLCFALSGLLPALLLLVLWLPLSAVILNVYIASLFEEQGLIYSAFQLQRLQAVSLGYVEANDRFIGFAAEKMQSYLVISVHLMNAACLLLMVLGCRFAYPYLAKGFNARRYVERITHVILAISGAVAIVITIGIVASIFVESVRFFSVVDIMRFLFGRVWSPFSSETASFGLLPLLNGTLLIAAIALLIAVPIGLFAAMYISEYGGRRTHLLVRPLIEALASIPTIVYGFVAVFTLSPILQGASKHLGYEVGAESALVAGVALGVMIIPYVSSLSGDVMQAVPQSLRQASLALGATRSETVKHVVLPAAMPGILAGVLLAASRAIGETMIVLMAAGFTAQLTLNPMQPVATITSQIVTLLTGNQNFDSVQSLAAFALGLSLLVFTLCLNAYALKIAKRYKAQLIRGYHEYR